MGNEVTVMTPSYNEYRGSDEERAALLLKAATEGLDRQAAYDGKRRTGDPERVETGFLNPQYPDIEVVSWRAAAEPLT